MMEHAHRLKIGHDGPTSPPRIVLIERHQMIDLAPRRRHVATGERARAIRRPNDSSDAGTGSIGHRSLRWTALPAVAVGKDAPSTLGLLGNPCEPPHDQPIADRLLPQHRDGG